MQDTVLFTAALQLTDPWYVDGVEFKDTEDKSKELHININFRRGAKFHIYTDENDESSVIKDVDGKPVEYTAKDTYLRTWRHLNFFQYRTYIHARVPKVSDGQGHCPSVRVPWARPGSGFTLLFEALVLELAKVMPVAAVSRIVDEHDTRLWRFIRYYVDKARDAVDETDVNKIGIDETSKKGHNYITVVVSLDSKNVIYATDGKDATTVERFAEDLKAHGGDPQNIRIVTSDMSLGFKKAVSECFVNSNTIIDKFHIIKHANEAVDAVRKAEVRQNPLLKRTKYLWLKNDRNLSEKQRSLKSELCKKHIRTGKAYAMRVELQEIYESANNRKDAEAQLKKLCSWIMHSRIEQMKVFCKTLRNHWNEILNYFEYRYTNAILEGTNSVIQKIKGRSRGFRNVEYFKTMIYLVCGGLDLDAIVRDALATPVEASI